MHACIRTYVRTYMHACMHTYIHACMHTYIHTYIHIVSGLLWWGGVLKPKPPRTFAPPKIPSFVVFCFLAECSRKLLFCDITQLNPSLNSRACRSDGAPRSRSPGPRRRRQRPVVRSARRTASHCFVPVRMARERATAVSADGFQKARA